MAFLFAKFWLPLVIAALLGLMVGWATCNRDEPSWKSSWLPFGILAFVAGVFAATQMLLPGRVGMWLETALMMFSAYIAGCCLSCFLRTLILGAGDATVRDPHAVEYAMKVAGIGTTAEPAAANTVAYGSTSETETAMPRTYALRSSATDYTLVAAGVGTTAAAAIAQNRDQSHEEASSRRKAQAATPDGYTMPVAGINTLAGRHGVTGTAGSAAIAMTTGITAAAVGAAGVAASPAATAASASAATPSVNAVAAAALPGSGGESAENGNGKVVKPPLLAGPRNGKRDDLSLIWGVAEKLEDRMNRMGIWHFDQIAAWTPENIKWFEGEVEGFRGRLERDKWIEQCKKLAEGWRPSGNIGERPKG